LQPAEVRVSYTVPLVGMGDRAATLECAERHVGIIPQ
jgi:hypothetical protein